MEGQPVMISYATNSADLMAVLSYRHGQLGGATLHHLAAVEQTGLDVLAALFRVKSSRLNGDINRLCNQGFVVISCDRVQRLVHLTRRGRQAVEAAVAETRRLAEPSTRVTDGAPPAAHR